jgi:hypothetical protein
MNNDLEADIAALEAGIKKMLPSYVEEWERIKQYARCWAAAQCAAQADDGGIPEPDFYVPAWGTIVKYARVGREAEQKRIEHENTVYPPIGEGSFNEESAQ